MGGRNINRIPFYEWARGEPDCGKMDREGWRVHAACSGCQLQWGIDLGLIIRVRGPRFSLWGKRVRCRNLRCHGGIMTFYGLPPRGMLWGEMTRHSTGGGSTPRT